MEYMMSITTMTRIVSWLTALLFMLSALLFLQNRHVIPPFPTLWTKWQNRLFSHEVRSLHSLYGIKTDKPLKVALPLEPDVIKRTEEGLKFHLNTVLNIEKINGKIVKYIIQTAEDGQPHFTLDPKTKELKGTFKTFKHIADDGSIIVKLVPINPEWIKGS